MNDLARWLSAHGLDKYADRFAENEVTFGDLALLTEDDLREIGLPVGPRRRLLTALTGTGTNQLSTVNVPTSVAALEAQSTWIRHPDDRRPVTLLFADVTGSTALTEKLDPEETHAVLYGAVQRMGEAVEAHRGTVCRFMGDGLMAMFGVPVAFESHIREACSCALAMQAAMAGYSEEIFAQHGLGVTIRIGLHAGEVVALQVGDGARVEWDASGPAVPIAARMEQSARPGTVQLTRSTYELVEGHFVAERLEPVAVKGIGEPVEVVRLCRPRTSGPAAHGFAATPFVGRHAERLQMEGALRACAESNGGQIVYLRGDAGVGKTRLTQEVTRDAEDLGFKVHRVLVLDFGVAKGQAAIPALIRSLLGLPSSSDKSQRRAAAERAVAEGWVAKSAAAFLNDALDLPQAVLLAGEFQSMSAERRMHGRRMLVRDLLVARSAEQPLLLVVEDVHWADSVTLSYLVDLIRAVGELAVVLLLTTRPSVDPLSTNWAAYAPGAPVAVLNLGPLRAQETETLASHLGVRDEQTLRACIERSEGNPLFLVELLRLGATDGGGTLPTSVQTLVATRLDQLAPNDKAAAQAAAVIGQRFFLDVLGALMGAGGYDPRPLVEAQLVRPDTDGFLFSHALIQEGVLGSLLKPQRKALHAKAAEWYAGRDLTLHARHLALAGDPGAARAYLAAAREQLGLLRFVAALDLAGDGLHLGADTEVAAPLHALCGDAHIRLGESRKAVQAYERALERVEDEAERSEIRISASYAYRNLGEHARGLQVLEDAESFAAASPELLARIEFHRGNLCALLEDWPGAERAYGRGNRQAVRAGSPELQALSMGGMARFYAITGRLGRIATCLEACFELCQAHDLPHVQAQFVHMAGLAACWSKDLRTARKWFEESAACAPPMGEMRSAMLGHYGAAMVCCDLGDLHASGAHSSEALRLAELTGDTYYLPGIHSQIGRQLYLEGHRAQAADYLASAVRKLARHTWSLPCLLGTQALVGGPGVDRHALIVRGHGLHAGGGNGFLRLEFYKQALEAMLHEQDSHGVREQARKLETFMGDEPLMLGELLIERAMALTAHGHGTRGEAQRQRLESIRARLASFHYNVGLPSIDAALAEL